MFWRLVPKRELLFGMKVQDLGTRRMYCVQSGMMNSCFTCKELPTERYERRLLLVEKGTVRLVVFRILI